MLADELDFEENTVLLALEALEKLDMILTDNGVFTIAGWEEYQNTDRLAEIREYNRLAQQKSRAKRKLLQDVNSDVNDKSMTSQCCHDIEEEREEEKEEEKEIHSFIHSEAREDLNDPEKMRKYLGGIGKNVVFLSDEQMGDLLDKMTIEEFDYYVGVVAECELKGQHFKKKTHYQAILDMVAKDRKINNKR